MTTSQKVTPEDIDAQIESELYFQVGEAARALNLAGSVDGSVPLPTDLDLTVICVLTLKNGWTQLGISACADPQEFDLSIGQKVAREDAKDKLWPLLGYELKTKLTTTK